MKNLQDIKNRIKAVSDTRQITSAMETISVAKMRKATMRLDANRSYFNAMKETIESIAFHSDYTDTDYFNRAGEKTAYIVVASDKGLAGSFNHSVLSFALKTIKTGDHIFTIGQVAHEFFEKKGFSIDDDFVGATYDPSVLDATDMANRIHELFLKHEFDKIFIIYSSMEHSQVAAPCSLQLLPLAGLSDRKLTVDEEEALSEVEYEPDAGFVLKRLVPQFLTAMIYGALVKSVAAEHFARRAAMSNATNNADEILSELSLEYNRARQEIVTGQITEIITSSMGIKKD